MATFFEPLKRFLAAILLLAAGTLSAAGVEPTRKVRVILPSAASVVGPRILLGDVAQLTGGDRAWVTRLERLEIAQAAPAGGVLKLTAHSVRIAIRKSGIRGEVEVSGAETCEVGTRSQEFDTDSLASAVKSLVVSGTGESPEDIEVKLGRGQKLIVPAGVLTTRVKPPLSGKYEGNQLYTAEIMVDGRLVKKQPLRAQTEIRRPALVVLSRVERGEKLTEGNVASQRVPSSRATGDVLNDPSSALGRTAARALEPGRVLRVGDLADPPLVRRNGVVTALVRKGNIELAVEAKALDDGKTGQVIRIQNVASGKIFKARVVDDRNVEVVEPPKR